MNKISKAFEEELKGVDAALRRAALKAKEEADRLVRLMWWRKLTAMIRCTNIIMQLNNKYGALHCLKAYLQV